MNIQEPIRRYTRSRSRRRIFDVDLNAPPCERQEHEGPSVRTRSQDRQEAQQRDATQPPAIDVEALDDDVIISSPRAFAEVYHNINLPSCSFLIYASLVVFLLCNDIAV